jgi:hypothetical protein
MASWHEDPLGRAEAFSDVPEASGEVYPYPDAPIAAEELTAALGPIHDEELDALRTIVYALQPLDYDARSRIILWLAAKNRVGV